MGDPAVEGALRTSTLSPTPNNTLVQTGITHMATRVAFMALFIIIGFVGNCVLLATIAQSHRLKRSMLNLFVISAAIANLIDCGLNMPLILGSTILEKWDYGSFLCHFHACMIQTTSITMCLSLTLMSFDRFLMVIDLSKYKTRLTFARTNVLIVYSWVHSAVLSSPIIMGVIRARPFPARYLCSIAERSSVIYIAMTSLFGYILPFILIIIFYVIIIKTGVQEKLKESRNTEQQMYSNTSLDHPRLWVEMNAAKYIGSLVILWCLFQGPYLLINYIEEYRNSGEIAAGALFTYPWQLDFAFTWMKFAHPMFLPFATFFWRKEVWQKFKNLILCRKSIQINDASPTRSPDHHSVDSGRRENESNKTRSNVPVLFATTEGLHVQTFGKKSQESLQESNKDVSREEDVQNVRPVPTTRKCDVFGSRDFLQVDEDTSDYDSHDGEALDPFSTSDPLSVRTEYGQKVAQTTHAKSYGSLSTGRREHRQKGERKGQGKQGQKEIVFHTSKSMPDVDQFPLSNEKEETLVEDLQGFVHDDVVNEDAFEERISNDSGRGTVEKEMSKKYRDNGGWVSHETDPGINMEKRGTNQQNISSDLDPPPVIQKSPKKKRKKKKRKVPPDDDIEISNLNTADREVDSVIETENAGDRVPKVPRHPIRLAPLDHRHLPIRDVDLTLPDGQKLSKKMLNLDSSVLKGDPNFDKLVEMSNMDSQKKTVPYRKLPQPPENVDSNGDNNDGSVSRRPRSNHARRRTISSGDSQTQLLESGTSSDLSGLASVAQESTPAASAAPRKKKKRRPRDEVSSASQQNLALEDVTSP